MQPQVEALRHGVDVLVATPGRLLDHLGQRTVNLSHVEILVLDEADRMLDMGFIRDIRKVLAALPPKRQNLLFSATFSEEIRELAEGLLDNPASVEVARRNAESELVAQRIHPVAKDRKRALLSHLVKSGNWHQVLVFTRTKHGANRLAEQLSKDGVEATAIHGNKSQNARTRALAGFKSGEVRVLVATDIAARGLDIEELPHVVNFELPNVPEDYVHRIGRTGRAGCTGEAISLVSPDENPYLADIEKLLKRKIERTVIAGFEPGSAPRPDERIETAQDRERAPHPRQQQRRPQQQQQERRQQPGQRAAQPQGERRRPQRDDRRGPHQPASPRGAHEPRAPRDGNVSRPAVDRAAQFDERQPASNASAQFPSSGKAFDADRRGPRKSGPRQPVPALLGGSRRSG
jgi:ATP-dependent RNA helicase RhlE